MAADRGEQPNGTEDESTSRSRTRVSRACVRCRTRKDKCDGIHPSCATCLSAGVACSYEASTKKRGLPEGYVRGLEKLWTVLIHKIEGIEDVVAQIFNDDREALLQTWNDKSAGEALHIQWKESRVLQELETFLSALDAGALSAGKRKRDTNEDDATTQQDIHQDLRRMLTVAYRVSSTGPFSPIRDLPGSQAAFTQSESIRFPAEASKILDYYFKFTHCWLPILDRPYFLRRCYEFTRSDTRVSIQNADLAVLSAALAYTPAGVPDSFLDSSKGDLNWSKLAWDCIPTPSEAFEIGHIQALVLITLINIKNGNYSAAWNLLGLAIRAMQGLVRHESQRTRSSIAVAQACLILETVVAVQLDCRPHLNGNDIVAGGLLSEDGHEEWESWNAADMVKFYTSEPAFIISCFNNVTRIFAAINDYVSADSYHRSSVFDSRTEDTGTVLETLARTHSYSTLCGDSTPRPPHQVWLKTAHLLAVSLVNARQAGVRQSALRHLDDLGKILQSWVDCSTAGLTVLPPLICGLLEKVLSAAAPKMDTLSRANFSGLYTLPHILQTAGVAWPAAQDLATRLHEQLTGPSIGPGPPPQARSDKRPRLHQNSFDVLQTQHGSLNLWPADPFSTQIAAPPRQTAQSVMQQEDNMSINNYPGIDLDGTSIDVMSGVSDHGQPNANIATSPSFQGDEIDALFREMAQLDATEWSSGRTQGLRDLAFPDDLTFEAFCNDPDRLYSGRSGNENLLAQQSTIPPPGTLLYSGQAPYDFNSMDATQPSSVG
jgi:hypothetical protein